MAPSSRDRISVDLHGLKAALHARSLAKGVSPSALVRSILAEALSLPAGDGIEQHQAQPGPCTGERRARLCLRMSREEIGNFLGLTLETVSRLFSRFAREGLLKISQREVHLLDLAALRTLAGTECD